MKRLDGVAAPDDVSRFWRWDGKSWQDLGPKIDPADAVRNERARRLKASDWTQLPDIPPTTKALWEPYRQALRDVTQQPGFPHNVIWPTQPG